LSDSDERTLKKMKKLINQFLKSKRRRKSNIFKRDFLSPPSNRLELFFHINETRKSEKGIKNVCISCFGLKVEAKKNLKKNFLFS
jgi:hypothetical protein